MVRTGSKTERLVVSRSSHANTHLRCFSLISFRKTPFFHVRFFPCLHFFDVSYLTFRIRFKKGDNEDVSMMGRRILVDSQGRKRLFIFEGKKGRIDRFFKRRCSNWKSVNMTYMCPFSKAFNPHFVRSSGTKIVEKVRQKGSRHKISLWWIFIRYICLRSTILRWFLLDRCDVRLKF